MITDDLEPDLDSKMKTERSIIIDLMNVSLSKKKDVNEISLTLKNVST